MVRSVNEIRKYHIQARDGEIGAVEDFLFDDDAWTIRYVVVNTGKWMLGKSVLIAPSAMGPTEWINHRLHVDMTKEQIQDSPGVTTHQPVSQQRGYQLNAFGAWPMVGAQPVMVGVPVMEEEPAVAVARAEEQDAHLRSAKEVTGYHIQAIDGAIGHVDDFIADEQDWAIRYVVVDTRNWLPGRKVLIAPWMIQRVDWGDRSVHVELSREQVENSPPYDPDAPVNREYEEVFYDYYGRPVYW